MARFSSFQVSRNWMFSPIVSLFLSSLAWGQGGGAKVYLTEEQAPRTVFPEADTWEQKEINVTPALGQRIRQLAAPAKPTISEPAYVSFVARHQDKIIGYAVICEEIGKHRPITFIVGVTPDGKVKDVAIMTYREPMGDQVRHKNFLAQFTGKSLENPIMPARDIRNVSGATLSVRALARGVRKALAVIQAAYLKPEG